MTDQKKNQDQDERKQEVNPSMQTSVALNVLPSRFSSVSRSQVPFGPSHFTEGSYRLSSNCHKVKVCGTAPPGFVLKHALVFALSLLSFSPNGFREMRRLHPELKV